MDKKLFAQLVESMTEAGEIVRGKRAPSRKFRVGETDVRRIRRASGLSQAKFAQLIHVELGTLRNREQGRRTPTGPAQVLLRAIEKDPARSFAPSPDTDRYDANRRLRVVKRPRALSRTMAVRAGNSRQLRSSVGQPTGWLESG